MIGEGILAKLAGVISGAFLALVFDPPRSRLGFARRLSAAVVAGYVFGHLVLGFFEWEMTTENVIAAWCLAAFGSWSGMGVAKRLIDGYKKGT